MSSTDRELAAATRGLAGRLSTVLARTITAKPLIPYDNRQGRVYISFRDQGKVTTSLLNTRYGAMDLYIGLFCDAVTRDSPSDLWLRTTSYAYSLQPARMGQPLFRWEYVRPPDLEPTQSWEDNPSDWCRNHIQGDVTLEIADQRGMIHRVPLNDWHLPSGWVGLEEVIRFCIVDLKVPAQPGWNRVLKENSGVFMPEFPITRNR